MGQHCYKPSRDSSTNSDKDNWREATGRILMATKNALKHMDSFGAKFVHDTFMGQEYEDKQLESEHFQYDWFLTCDDEADDAKSDRVKILQDVEVILHKCRIAFELIHSDLEREGRSNVGKLFKDSSNFIKACLVEFNEAVELLKVGHVPEVRREDFMPNSVVQVEHDSFRHERDWILYRDTKRMLQQAIDKLEKVAEQVS